MRRSLLSLSLLLAACAAPPPPEAPKVEPSKEKKLDCAFARNLENCFRTVSSKLVACLGGKPSSVGKLQADDASMCLFPDDVAVKLGAPCNPDGKCEARDVFLGKGDKKCAEIHSTVERAPSEEGRGAGTLEVTIAEGTVKLEYDEKIKRVTCPDGAVYEGSGDWKKELAECADDTGYAGIPAWSTTLTASRKDGKKKLPGKVSVELGPETLFECESP
jgi:hypothetical protein